MLMPMVSFGPVFHNTSFMFLFAELPYTPEGMKHAWMHCNNALGKSSICVIYTDIYVLFFVQTLLYSWKTVLTRIKNTGLLR